MLKSFDRVGSGKTAKMTHSTVLRVIVSGNRTMKKLLLMLIDFYQNFISVILKNILGVSNLCRFEETCSQYAKRSIQSFGLVKGVRLSITRIVTCQPFYKAPFSKSAHSQSAPRGKKAMDL